MTVELTGLCRDHSFETAENLCRRCGLEYCELCLVYPFGAKKPLCKECAMVAGGVRSHASRPEMAKRDVKQRVKAWNARANVVRSTAAAAEDAITNPVLSDPLAPTHEDLERVPVTVPDDNVGHAAGPAHHVDDAPPPPPPPPAPASTDQPAEGVAPPIDWSQPFG